MYERHHEPLISREEYLRRIARSGGLAFAAILAALFLGVSGYHWIEGIPWVDSILNAAMILGGMGPVAELHTTAGKLFAAAYALFSGLMFIVVAGLLFAPVIHRFLHKFHLEARPQGQGQADLARDFPLSPPAPPWYKIPLCFREKEGLYWPVSSPSPTRRGASGRPPPRSTWPPPSP